MSVDTLVHILSHQLIIQAEFLSCSKTPIFVEDASTAVYDANLITDCI